MSVLPLMAQAHIFMMAGAPVSVNAFGEWELRDASFHLGSKFSPTPKLWATERTGGPLAIICKAWRLNSPSYLRRSWSFTFVFIEFILPSNACVRQTGTISVDEWVAQFHLEVFRLIILACHYHLPKRENLADIWQTTPALYPFPAVRH